MTIVCFVIIFVAGYVYLARIDYYDVVTGVDVGGCIVVYVCLVGVLQFLCRVGLGFCLRRLLGTILFLCLLGLQRMFSCFSLLALFISRAMLTKNVGERNRQAVFF